MGTGCAREQNLTEKNRRVNAGRLARVLNEPAREQLCADCGKQADHLHHEDYSKPEAVEPLCTGCHGKRHTRKQFVDKEDRTPLQKYVISLVREHGSYSKAEKATGVNRGLLHHVATGRNDSPSLRKKWNILKGSSEPDGMHQWKARVPDELFDRLQRLQERTGKTRAQLLDEMEKEYDE